jgi:hypothetical protein
VRFKRTEREDEEVGEGEMKINSRKRGRKGKWEDDGSGEV